MDGGMDESTANINSAVKNVAKKFTRADERIWILIDIIGLVLLAVGAVIIMWSMTSNRLGPAICMGVGIALIILSSTAVGIQGHLLRKKYEKYQRFDEVRKEASAVPDDLEGGYLIDYTAEPGKAVQWSSEPKDEDPLKVNS